MKWRETKSNSLSLLTAQPINEVHHGHWVIAYIHYSSDKKLETNKKQICHKQRLETHGNPKPTLSNTTKRARFLHSHLRSQLKYKPSKDAHNKKYLFLNEHQVGQRGKSFASKEMGNTKWIIIHSFLPPGLNF